MTLTLPNTRDTELANAARLAPWACAAYHRGQSADISRLMRKHHGEWETFESYHAHGIWGMTAHGAIVAIAGTDDPSDWQSNLDRGPYPLGRFGFEHDMEIADGHYLVQLHTGFLQQAANIALELQQILPHLGQSRHLWIVGHSLGGAIAELMPLVWPELRPHVVTFGAPRVVHWGSPQKISSTRYASHYRFVTIDDLVPQMPLGYRHPPADLRILRGPGQVRHSLGWRDLVWRTLRRVWYAGKPISASRAAHACSRYAKWLEVWR